MIFYLIFFGICCLQYIGVKNFNCLEYAVLEIQAGADRQIDRKTVVVMEFRLYPTDKDLGTEA